MLFNKQILKHFLRFISHEVYRLNEIKVIADSTSWEEKQKEILDSIHYAKRIQQSLMPTGKYIDKQLRKLNG